MHLLIHLLCLLFIPLFIFFFLPRIATIEVQIAKLDSEAWPGLLDPERDRLILINEKEELLKELQYVNPRQRLEPNDAERLESQKKRLERDLQAARDNQSKALTERWGAGRSHHHQPGSSSFDTHRKSVSGQQPPGSNMNSSHFNGSAHTAHTLRKLLVSTLL